MGPDLAPMGRLLASRTRAAFLSYLLQQREVSGVELAKHARVAPSTASEHLRLLVDSGLLTVRQAGRDRYYALAGVAVAEALEAMARISPLQPVRSLRQARAADNLRLARTCYDHLAGAVAVALLDTMIQRDWISADSDSYRVTAAGRLWLSDLAVDLDDVARSRRAFARPCLDWTERRFHLGGALGAAIASATLDGGWFRRTAGGRALVVTDIGRSELRRLGVDDGLRPTHGGDET